MKDLKFKKAHDLGQLLEELEMAVSALRPVMQGGERVAVMSVTGQGEDILLLVPDGVDEAAVRAVVEAHTVRPKPPPPDLDAMLEAVEAANSYQAFKVAFVAYERAKHPERRRAAKK